MNKVLIIVRHEMANSFRRPSFFISVFVIPVIIFLLLAGVSLLNTQNERQNSEPQKKQNLIKREGWVDASGVIKFVPAEIPKDSLVQYPNELAAQKALANKSISAFYLIPCDFIDSGNLIYIQEKFSPFSPKDQLWKMDWTILSNLLNDSFWKASQIQTAVKFKKIKLDPGLQPEDSLKKSATIAMAMACILAFVLLMTSSLLLNALTHEKKNRVLEIILLSVTPRQLFAGKIIGLGLVGLMQMAFWGITGFFLWLVGQKTMSLPPDLQISVPLILACILFFLLGYMIFACLLAGLGALVPSMKEASFPIFIMTVPLAIPLLFAEFLLSHPHGALTLLLSLFPLTAAPMMTMRLAMGGVPVFQIFSSIALMVLAILFIIRMNARLFQTQYILSGQSLTRKLFTTLSKK